MRPLEDHQRATIAAAMARIIPTDDTPGAAEAGTIDFLEGYLSGERVYALPDGSGFEQLHGKDAWAWRTRIERARRLYDEGVAELDRRADHLHGDRFVDLDDGQQDDVLRAMDQAAPEGEFGSEDLAGELDEPALQQVFAEADLTFFGLLCLHTRQGFYSDPVYGGNQGHAGWEAIGFPGPASLADVHDGTYTTTEYFVDLLGYPGGGGDERTAQ